MKEEAGKAFGKYVPINKNGQVRFYLPLEKYVDLNELSSNGYEVAEESRDLVRIATLIREAKSQQIESDQKKHEFVAAVFADFSQEAGSIDLVCPYCLGRINHNFPLHEDEILCGWYDEISNCDGTASYTTDRANLVLGIPDVERYTCRARGTELQLSVYDLHYLREEIARRTSVLQRSLTIGGTNMYDVELAKIFPLRVSLDRTRRSFKEIVQKLMDKDAISWVNTLSIEELGSMLQKATSSGTQGL